MKGYWHSIHRGYGVRLVATTSLNKPPASRTSLPDSVIPPILSPLQIALRARADLIRGYDNVRHDYMTHSNPHLPHPRCSPSLLRAALARSPCIPRHPVFFRILVDLNSPRHSPVIIHGNINNRVLSVIAPNLRATQKEDVRDKGTEMEVCILSSRA